MNSQLRIASIVGARPQFIKLAPIVRAIDAFTNHQSPITNHRIIHTGQHYDYLMSKVFFDELGIPEPDYNLEVGSGTHGWQTAEMIKRIEKVLLKEKPHIVLVYGDTNSTLAGALASSKIKYSITQSRNQRCRPLVAHIEAGLRSYNKNMPEEINRVLTDHCSDILFCPTKTAISNLQKEGFTNIFNEGKLIDEAFINNYLPIYQFTHSPVVLNVGDIMYDALLISLKIAEKKSNILSALSLELRKYYLCTIHRAENTDNPERLKTIIEALIEISKEKMVIFPIHPRTRKIIEMNYSSLVTNHSSLVVINPVSYFDMLLLEKHAAKILTDSGGVQKEAYILGVPCITLREETEWTETVEAGWNMLVGADKEKIMNAEKLATQNLAMGCNPPFPIHNSPFATRNLYGDGQASTKIIEVLLGIACSG